MKRLLSVFAILVVGAIAYSLYSISTGGERVAERCAEIKPGMTLPQLQEFAKKQDFSPVPAKTTGHIWLAETRSYGRFTCRVTLKDGVVVEAIFSHQD